MPRKITRDQATLLELVIAGEIWAIRLNGRMTFHWNGGPIPDGGKRFVDQLLKKGYVEFRDPETGQRLVKITEEGRKALYEFEKTAPKLASRPMP